MAKAKRVRDIHADCPSCGIHIVIDADTGDVSALAKGKKDGDKIQDPPSEESKKGAKKSKEGSASDEREDQLVEDPEDESAEGDSGENESEDENEWGRGSW